jgi:hypothetical protein
MKLRNVLVTCALVLGLVACGVTVAQNVNPNRNPNLAAAQVLIEQAMEKVTVAQRANEYDMGGHAAKAKELLSQAYREIKLAARAANRNGR